MTKQEILDVLEALKELTNDTGKQTIDSVKAAVQFLREPVPIEEKPPVPEPEPEPEIPPKVFKPLNVKVNKKPVKKGAKK
jgi:hypothetical protein